MINIQELTNKQKLRLIENVLANNKMDNVENGEDGTHEEPKLVKQEMVDGSNGTTMECQSSDNCNSDYRDISCNGELTETQDFNLSLQCIKKEIIDGYDDEISINYGVLGGNFCKVKDERTENMELKVTKREKIETVEENLKALVNFEFANCNALNAHRNEHHEDDKQYEIEKKEITIEIGETEALHYIKKEIVEKIETKYPVASENKIEMKYETVDSADIEKVGVQDAEDTESNEKQNKCDICSKYFIWKSDLVRHYKIHNKVCKICNKTFRQRFTLQRHLLTAHGKGEKLKICAKKLVNCRACGLTFGDKDFARHEETHIKDRPYACNICNKRFSRKTHCADHERTHTDDRPYMCKVCDRSFAHKSAVRRHMKVMHGDFKMTDTNFKCSICNKYFKDKYNLDRHEQIHSGGRPYACKICDKRFVIKSHLTDHERTHTKERPHMCKICGKSYTQKSVMTRHMKSMHSNDDITTAMSNSHGSYQVIIISDPRKLNASAAECSLEYNSVLNNINCVGE